MIPIVKKAEPAVLTKAKQEIRNTPDTPFNYSSLRGENKRKVLDALVSEQGHLCAYCMCRIGTDKHPATIEHIVPQHPRNIESDGELSLSFKNMVAVCDGREGATCDKRRGNKPLTVNPTKPDSLKGITYRRNGEIDAEDDTIQHDLQITLGLNAPQTNLCANRAAAMSEIERVISSQIRRKKIESNRSAKEKLCRDILAYFENQDDMKDEYLGAKIFKAQRLVAKFLS